MLRLVRDLCPAMLDGVQQHERDRDQQGGHHGETPEYVDIGAQRRLRLHLLVELPVGPALRRWRWLGLVARSAVACGLHIILNCNAAMASRHGDRSMAPDQRAVGKEEMNRMREAAEDYGQREFHEFVLPVTRPEPSPSPYVCHKSRGTEEARVGEVVAMPTRFNPGVFFEPEAIGPMSDALEAVCNVLPDASESHVVREAIAGRIIAAASMGERDPFCLRAAALSGAAPHGERIRSPRVRAANRIRRA
jgi:hypothetical protein